MKPVQWFVVATACCVATGFGCERLADRPAPGPNAVDGAVPVAGRVTSDASQLEPSDDSTEETTDEPTTAIVPLSERTAIERKHRAAEAEWERLLRKRIDIELDDVPLPEALAELARRAGSPVIAIDNQAIMEEGTDLQSLVTCAEKRITLGQALWRILDPLELTWIFQDEEPVVTTLVRADEHLTTRSHSVSRIFRVMKRIQREQGETMVVDPNRIINQNRDPYEYFGALCDVLLQETSGSWMDIDGTGGTITILEDIITVRQTLDCQEQVAWLLRVIEDYARADFRTGSAAYEPRWVQPADAHSLDVALGRPVARIAFAKTPLRKALQALAKDAELRLFFDEKALKDEQVYGDEPVTLAAEGLSLRAVLNRVLRSHNATAVADHGFLRVTTAARADEILHTIVYDVRDLLEPGRINFGPVIDMIQQETSGPWQDINGTGGTINDVLDGGLVIRQTEKCHLEIAALLEDLREKRREEAVAIKDPPTDADADGLVLKIYALASPELVKSLAGCVQELSPQTWIGRKGQGTVHAVDTALVVRQTTKVHTQIEQFLSDLMRAVVVVSP